MGGAAVQVATVITRLEGGAGQHALRGALIMDPAAYEMAIITGSGDPLLLERAASGGLEVLIVPALRAPIGTMSPRGPPSTRRSPPRRTPRSRVGGA